MTTVTTRSPFAPRIDVPNTIPAAPVDIFADDIDANDLITTTYMSMEQVQSRCRAANVDGIVLTVNAVTVEFLYNPVTDPNGIKGDWKPVLWFADSPQGLPMNVTRKRNMEELTGSSRLSRWRTVGTIAIKPDIVGGNATLVIERIPQEPPARHTPDMTRQTAPLPAPAIVEQPVGDEPPKDDIYEMFGF